MADSERPIQEEAIAKLTVYQDLGAELTAIEPPLWCRLLGGYVQDRGYAVDILDSEAENKGPQTVAREVQERQPRVDEMVSIAAHTSWRMP